MTETRKIKQEIKTQMSQRKYERDAENRVIVNMTVKDDADFLSVFSENSTPVISSEVAGFIEEATHSILPKQQLTLRIHSSCIDNQEKDLYKEAIKEHYLERYILNKRELKRNAAIALLLTFVGIMILAVSIFLGDQIDSAVWGEVIDIVAWVLLWEAVDIIAFKNRELRVKRRRYLSYLSMKIEFYPEM